MALNPQILGRPLFPSARRTEELLGGFGQSVINAITPATGTPPATMAGVTVPPAGASLGQLQFAGPLIRTSRFNQPEAPQPVQPAQQAFNYGAFAATQGLPSFDVTKTQTPFSQYSASAPQQMAALATRTAPQQAQIPTQVPIFPTKPQEPRSFTAVRAGTIEATPQQLEFLNARTTAYESRTPAQQQELLAQVRQRGADMAKAQETFFAEKRQEREALRGAEALARAQGARPMDIMRAREAATAPSTIAGIRAEASPYQAGPRPSFAMTAQSRFAENVPVGGSRPRQVGGLGLSGMALYEAQQASRRAAGITGPYSNVRAQQRRASRESIGSDALLSALGQAFQQVLGGAAQ